MLRKTKDNYFILILFIISITMLFTICSSDAVAEHGVSNHNQTIVLQNYNSPQYRVSTIELSEIQKITRRNNKKYSREMAINSDQNLIEWEGYEIKVW